MVDRIEDYPPFNTMGLAIDPTGIVWRYHPPSPGGIVEVPPVPQPPVNVTPPLSQAVSGFAQGDLLVCGAGSWTGATPFAYTYQWQVSPVGTPIAGATANQWTISGQVGNMVRCAVTATNSAGTGTQVSNAIGPITA